MLPQPRRQGAKKYYMKFSRQEPRKAGRIDTLIMRGLVAAFDKVLYPMGVKLIGVGTVALRIARLRGTPLAEQKLEGGGRFLYPVYDSYWAYCFLTGRTYEPDLYALLRRLLANETRFAFIDGGANFGYWSCFLAQRPELVAPIVAIEPTPATFSVLKQNSAANSDRITCIQAALSDVDGGHVAVITGNYHTGNRVISVTDDATSKHPIVPSVSVDSIIERYCAESPLVVIKLDVEGFEPQALAGASRALAAGHPVIYECHGSDRECSSTRAAMERGLAIYFLTESGEPIRIDNIEALLHLKTNPTKGYNLVGIRRGSAFESVIAMSI